MSSGALLQLEWISMLAWQVVSSHTIYVGPLALSILCPVYVMSDLATTSSAWWGLNWVGLHLRPSGVLEGWGFGQKGLGLV